MHKKGGTNLCTLYERITELCKEKNVSRSRMCLDLGLSKSTMSNMKNGRQAGISTETAQKIASYFNVSVGCLLGEEELNQETEKKNDTLSDIILTLRMDSELLDIVENITKLDADKRNVLKSFLSTFLSDK